jgi:CAAX prenyl protease-like protein
VTLLRNKFRSSPGFARAAPYVAFVLLTWFQGHLGPLAQYWVYLAKTLIGAWLIFEMPPFVEEMRWRISWEAVVIGLAVFAIWVGLDGHYPRLHEPSGDWYPAKHFPQNASAMWFFIGVRILGSSLVVPPLEEVFFRSFCYRFVAKPDFMSMPLNQFHLTSFLVVSAVFGLMHPDRWLAGILCGLGFQWLVIRKGSLGDAIVAHAITNFLLGVWVVWKGAWDFW